MDFLKKLTQTLAPSGNEENVLNVIVDEIKDYADEIYKDALGNLIVRKKGNGKKIMFAAHADEIGLIITYIDKKGFLRFSQIGGIDPFYSLYQRVEFLNGTAGVVCYEENIDDIKNLSLDKMYIDIGASSKEQAEKLVSVGDVAGFSGPFFQMGEKIVSKALDNRVGVYVLAQALKTIEKPKNDLYFVFTSQEEIGLRGARPAAYSIAPDIAISVDITIAADTPKCKPMEVKLGDGPAIKVMDASIITNKQIRDSIKDLAIKNNIPYQTEILTMGGTDAGAIHITGEGIKTGAVSIPIRYVHSVCETANINDIKNTISLVSIISKNL